MVFQDVPEIGKTYSSITNANSVSRGSNPTMQMAITPDGSVLAVLDDKSLLTLHFLDEGTSEWKILSEGESLATLRENGRIAIVSAVDVSMSFWKLLVGGVGQWVHITGARASLVRARFSPNVTLSNPGGLDWSTVTQDGSG